MTIFAFAFAFGVVTFTAAALFFFFVVANMSSSLSSLSEESLCAPKPMLLVLPAPNCRLGVDGFFTFG